MNQESPSALEPSAPPEHAPHPARQTRGSAPRRKRRRWVWVLTLAALAAGIYFLWPKKNTGQAGRSPSEAGPGQRPRQMTVPVVGATARRGTIPVYFTGLGAVTPIYTVTVRSRVDGELMQIYYKEGDIVHKGDPLVEIDPRPYQVQLTQAEGQLIKDQALLENARIDLARYKTLLTQNAVPEQQVVTQQALVTQDEGTVKTDQGVIDSAKLNLVYCHITAPITGRIGLRLVDPGNIVHATDTNGLLVITQIEPISVIFTIAEDQLPIVLQKLRGGQRLRVDAYDRTLNTKVAEGWLTTLDNQIDQTTGTLRLRATFDNKDDALFPNQFVNARLLVQVKQGVTLLPTATIQRNSQTTYVFLVKPDSTVTVRAVGVGTTEGEESEITSGVAPGDVVVMTGVDKLQEGTKVSVHFGTPAKPATNMPGVPANTAPVVATPPAPHGNPVVGNPARSSSARKGK
jgi:multidrug efflux system membrane fusion protein